MQLPLSVLRYSLFLLVLAALFALASCNASGALGDDDDDDVITPPDDDDDDDDDDDTDDDDDDAGPPSLSFDRSEAGAGDLLWLTTTWQNFELTQQTSICCTSEELVTFQVGEVSGNSIPVLFFFGLHAEGDLEWGLNNGQGEEAVGTIAVSPLNDIPVITPGIATVSSSIDEEGGFNVFEIEVPTPLTIVTARATNLGDDEFHPWLLVLAEDGYSPRAAHGYYNAQVQQEPFVSFVAPEAGTYYIRVQDNALGGGHTFGYDLDLGMIQAEPPSEIPEVEPNNAAENFQDLGVLSPGGRSIIGTAETAGHAGNNDLNGDLDVFTFTLEESSLVWFSLEWPTGEDNDFDAVVYDYDDGELELGFGSDDALSTEMASTAQPETVNLEMEPGTYAVQVGNWEGDPDAEYRLNLWVLPSQVAP
jgi:predicted small lipoprotein YifL